MKHVNPNMIVPVLEGIEAGEAARGHTLGPSLLADQYQTIESLTAPPTPGAYRAGNLVRAKAIAHAQGFIAGYRG